MLYISTHNKTDVYTAYRVLHSDFAGDGGAYVPFALPKLSKAEIRELKGLSYGKVISRILNLFFSTSPSGVEIEFLADRYPAKTLQISHRIMVAQTWHNQQFSYAAAEKALFAHLCGKNMDTDGVTDWCRIAIRIATLFAIYAQLLDQNILEESADFDVTVNTGDFFEPIACWYARNMGLPVRTIICSCNENGGIWDFINRGELNTGATLVKTTYPEQDYVVPTGLQRLIYGTLGKTEVLRFADIVSQGKLYSIEQEHPTVAEGYFASVISSERVPSVIRSVYRSCGFFLDPYAAFSFAGVQDYRAKTGESKLTLLIADRSPLLYRDMICECCGITEKDLIDGIKKY